MESGAPLSNFGCIETSLFSIVVPSRIASDILEPQCLARYTFKICFSRTLFIFRFKMQRGSVCDSSLSSLSLISGSAGDISMLNNSASSNKKSPDIPEKVRKKSLPTTEDDSCIYDIPRPVFRFSSDFEDDSFPPPPPPVR